MCVHPLFSLLGKMLLQVQFWAIFDQELNSKIKIYNSIINIGEIIKVLMITIKYKWVLFSFIKNLY